MATTRKTVDQSAQVEAFRIEKVSVTRTIISENGRDAVLTKLRIFKKPKV